MVNLKFVVAYLGYQYYGWAKQPNQPQTIQAVIENELAVLFPDQPIQIIGSGRTDKFVHANNQVFNLKLNTCLIPLTHLKEVLNKKFIKKNIYIKHISYVSNDFNARYSAISKTYKYYINTGKFNLSLNDLMYQYNQPVDLNKMQIAANLFLGTHNFLSFSTSELEDTIRTVNKLEIQQHKQVVIIKINANGFLRSMVRMIVACLLKFAADQISLTQITALLENPKKGAAIQKANACGLYLDEVIYESNNKH